MAELKSALHASAPEGHKCADCSIAEEPCPTCYAAWWKERHPDHNEIKADFQGAFLAFATVLDAIERAIDDGSQEEASRLVHTRFELVEQYGMTVEFTGMPVSGEKH